MNGKELDGSRLVVQVAGDKRRERFDTEKRKGPQKEDVCYNCQESGHWYEQLKNYLLRTIF